MELTRLYNTPKIQKKALCPCRKHEFPLEECTLPHLQCTGGETIPLEHLAPDLLLAHIDQRYMIDEKDLALEETPASLLGEGSFGSVFRAKL